MANLTTQKTFGFDRHSTHVLLWLTLAARDTMGLMGDSACVAVVTMFHASPTDIGTLITLFTVKLCLVDILLAFRTVFVLVQWQPEASKNVVLLY